MRTLTVLTRIVLGSAALIMTAAFLIDRVAI